MSTSLVLVAAGSGTRLGAGVRKGFVELGGMTVIERAVRAFVGIDAIGERILVVHPDDVAGLLDSELGRRLRESGITAVVAGGATRTASALAGVEATSTDAVDVLVHDAARPFVAAERVRALIDALATAESALLAVPSTSTVKRADDAGRVAETLDRRRIHLATTPQGARRSILLRVLREAVACGKDGTDEASLLEAAGFHPALVEDASTNLKITHPGDLALASGLLPREPDRVGFGWDIHRLVPGRPLVLCGVVIPFELGLLGHSDADAVLHAVCDALLGAAGLPDIGEHFPDTDPRWKGADSAQLLLAVVAALAARGLRAAQVDVSILAERPKLLPYKDAMRRRLRALLDLPDDRVAVKARTGEGLDAVGRGEAIACHAVATVTRSGTP